MIGHNRPVDPRAWREEISLTTAHPHIKLIVHTIELLMKEGAAVVSDDELARRTSLSVKTIRKYRKEAQDDGWVEFKSGIGRGNTTAYSVSIPQKTLLELASRLAGVSGEKLPPQGYFCDEKGEGKVTPAGQPFRETLPHEGNFSGKGAKESTPGMDTFSDKSIPAGGAFTAPESPPHPPEKKYNNTPLTPQTSGPSMSGRNFWKQQLNPQDAKAHEDVWFDADGRLQAVNGFRSEIEANLPKGVSLRDALDRCAEFIPTSLRGIDLKKRVRGKIADLRIDNAGRDRRAAAARSQSSYAKPATRDLLDMSDLPSEKPRPRLEADA